MAEGVVKWFSNEKGYGFITPDDGGPDHFVHYSEIQGEGHRSLSDGAKVSYEPGEGPKGPVATEVNETGQAEPEAEQAEPEAEQAEPEAEQAEPETEQAEPEAEQAEPEAEQAEPEE